MANQETKPVGEVLAEKLSSTALSAASALGVSSTGSQDYLFSPEILSALVSPSQASAGDTPLPENWSLPERFTLRPLRISDHDSGFLQSLESLTQVGKIDKAQFQQKFQNLKRQGNYYIIVMEDKTAAEPQSSVVATGTLLVEDKFIHGLSKVGHVEDVAVVGDWQGKGLGKVLVPALDYLAQKLGCYKCILDCNQANTGFYAAKTKFVQAGFQMAHYYPDSKSKA